MQVNERYINQFKYIVKVSLSQIMNIMDIVRATDTQATHPPDLFNKNISPR